MKQDFLQVYNKHILCYYLHKFIITYYMIDAHCFQVDTLIIRILMTQKMNVILETGDDSSSSGCKSLNGYEEDDFIVRG